MLLVKTRGLFFNLYPYYNVYQKFSSVLKFICWNMRFNKFMKVMTQWDIEELILDGLKDYAVISEFT